MCLVLSSSMRSCTTISLIKRLRVAAVSYTHLDVYKRQGVDLEIPIDSATQNAIIDYILNERRDCEQEYIFVTSVGPVSYTHLDVYKRQVQKHHVVVVENFGFHNQSASFISWGLVYCCLLYTSSASRWTMRASVGDMTRPILRVRWYSTENSRVAVSYTHLDVYKRQVD